MIKIYAEVLEQEALNQFYRAMSLPCNIQGALMPDAHAGYTLPIGAVVKSENKVFPSYVGYDIGCGMCAVRTDINVKDINKDDLVKLKDEITKSIPLGMNKHKRPQRISKEILSMDMTDFAREILNHTGIYQLGTLGGETILLK